jgi:plasmid stability protein
MRSARKHADRMPVTIQIRNVPSDLHRKLKARTAVQAEDMP